ncbi:unnamed protein product, partial [Sphacelaria rigidula]
MNVHGGRYDMKPKPCQGLIFGWIHFVLLFFLLLGCPGALEPTAIERSPISTSPTSNQDPARTVATDPRDDPAVGFRGSFRLDSPLSSALPVHVGAQLGQEQGLQYRGRGGHGVGGDSNGGVSRGRHAGRRRQIKSEAATFFNSLDENSDGVLEKEEIREFVIDVGGSTLDDTSEIWGGVSRVMGRLDTDSDEGIGLKELSSWINNLGSILTVEEAADWVLHAVQLPIEVAEAFRSNSVSGYDFPELVADNGAGLYYDLGIKRAYRKRIVQAIEIRLLGLGDEPLPPVMKTPVYLGNGKAKIEWSPGGMEFTNLPDATYVTPTADVNLEKDSKTGDATVTAPSFTAKELQAGFPKPKPASQEEPGLPGSEVREANEEYQQRHTPSSSAPSASGSWTSGYLNSESLGDATSPDLAAGSAGAVDRVYEPPLEGIEPAVAGVQGSCSSSAVAGDTAGKGRAVAAAQAERAATFPVHKYVLERSCLHVDASRASKSQHTSNVASATNVNADASPSPNEGSAQAGPSS